MYKISARSATKYLSITCLLFLWSADSFLPSTPAVLHSVQSRIFSQQQRSDREHITETLKAVAAVSLLTSAGAAKASASYRGLLLLDLFSDQVVTSVNSNTLKEDWKAWKGPPLYTYKAPPNTRTPLPYPTISDNTEGIAGFDDLPIPADDGLLLVDIGGGRFDACKLYVENKYRKQKLQFVIIDPFARSPEYNAMSQSIVDDAGGADVATSISVLNVIETRAHRTRHIKQVHSSLKKGGLAFFKIWAGFWPGRGSGAPGIFLSPLHALAAFAR
jgi:hypothetical protein